MCETFIEFCLRRVDQLLRLCGFTTEIAIEMWEDEGGSTSD